MGCNKVCQAKKDADAAKTRANNQARTAQTQASTAQSQANNQAGSANNEASTAQNAASAAERNAASASSSVRTTNVIVNTRTKVTTVGDIIVGKGAGAASQDLASTANALGRGRNDSRIQKAGLSGLLGAGQTMANIFRGIAAAVFGWRIVRMVVDTIFYLGAVIFNFTAIGVFVPHLLQLLLKMIIANLGNITGALIRLIMSIPVLTETITDTTSNSIQSAINQLKNNIGNAISKGFEESGFNFDDVDKLPDNPSDAELEGFLENKFDEEFDKIKKDVGSLQIDIVSVIGILDREENTQEIYDYLKKMEEIIKEIAIVSNSFNPFNDDPDRNILINASLINSRIREINSLIGNTEGLDFEQIEEIGEGGIFDQAKVLEIPIGFSERIIKDFGRKSIADMFKDARQGNTSREILNSIAPLYKKVLKEKSNLIDSFLYINAITQILNDPRLKSRILDILRNAFVNVRLEYKGYISNYNTMFVYGYMGETQGDYIRERIINKLTDLNGNTTYQNLDPNIEEEKEERKNFVKIYLKDLENEILSEFNNSVGDMIRIEGELSPAFESGTDTLFNLEDKIQQSIVEYKSHVINQYRKALTKKQLISYETLGLEDDLNIDRFNAILKTHINDLYVNAILLKINNFIEDKKDKKIRDKKEYLHETVDMAIQSLIVAFRKYSKTILSVVNEENDPSAVAITYVQSNGPNFFNGRPDEVVRRNLLGMEEKINEIIFQEEIRDFL